MRRNRWPDVIGMGGRMFRNTQLLRHTYAGKDLWVLKGIHARGNARVGKRDRQDIEALLRLRGITALGMGHAAGVSDKLAAVLSPDVDFHDNY